jgi:long-chain acyl-CoA synthetase
LTYAELDRKIDAARGAFAELGLMPTDRILLLLPSGAEFVIAYFGAIRAGLVVIPLNPLLGTEEVGHILKTMRPALVVAAPADCPFPLMGALEGLTVAAGVRLTRYGGGDFDAVVARARTDLPTICRDADDETLILFTSGISGRPKGASHREGTVITNVRHGNERFAMHPGDVFVCPLPLSHVFGQIVMMMGSFMAGAEMALARPGPAAIMEVMEERGVTILAGVPTIFAALTEIGRSDPQRASRVARTLRFAFAGGAPLSAATGEAFEAVFGIPVHQGYGMTEVACCISVENETQRPSGGVGTLSTVLEHRIIPLDSAVPDEGELELSGPNLLRGYYIDGVLEPRTPDMWFATGDLVRKDQGGNLFLFDRKKELIIRNGYNVYPSEVEAMLCAHPDVVLAAVIGVADPAVGQEVAAFVTVRTGADADGAALVAWCKARIALYKYPRLIAILPVMPTSPTGKIQKRELDVGDLRRVDA